MAEASQGGSPFDYLSAVDFMSENSWSFKRKQQQGGPAPINSELKYGVGSVSELSSR